MSEFTLPAPPSANRWWRNVGGRMVLSKAAREYKAALPLLVPRRQVVKAPAQVKVTVHWFRGIKSGDLDKRLGVVLDALQGVCYDNDSQIVELHAYRSDDPGNGRIVVSVEAL